MLHLLIKLLYLQQCCIENYTMKDRFVGLHLDFVGFSASMLCAVHCAALPFLLSLAPLAGLQFLNDPWIEYVIILTSFFIASYALLHGYRRHHKKPLALIIVTVGFLLILIGHLLDDEWIEIILTSCGGATIAIAHLINWKYMKQVQVGLSNCKYQKNF